MVAGIVLTFELGMNWGIYAHDVGPIVGVIIGLEVATAFFLEAGFVGIMLYGEGRVSKRVTLLANGMVAVGTLLSVTWILAANSWMQTPAGYKIVDGQFQPKDWVQVIFNPSFGWRFIHMLVAVLIASTWLIAGIAAYYVSRGLYKAFSRRTLSICLALMAILIPWQLFIGSNVAQTMAMYEPAKLVTVDGNYNSTNNGYNVLIIPDPAAGKNIFRIEIPHLGALYLGDLSGKATSPSINILPKNVRPNIYALFYGFRVMWLVGLTLFGTTMVGLYLRLRRKLYDSRRFLRWLTWTTPIGVLAIVGGWIVAEAGRQPYVVYGLLRTDGAVSHLSAGSVIASFVGFVGLYVVMLTVWITYLVRQVKRGPEPIESLESHQDPPTIPTAPDVEIDAPIPVGV